MTWEWFLLYCRYTCMCFQWTAIVMMHLHMFTVELHDLVHEGHLVRNVVIIEEMLPALNLLEISNLSWERKREREYSKRRRWER